MSWITCVKSPSTAGPVKGALQDVEAVVVEVHLIGNEHCELGD